MSLAIWAVLAIPGLAYWVYYLRGLPRPALPTEKSATFGSGDMVAAILLGLLFAWNIFAGTQKPPAITRDMIIQSCVIYSLFVIMLLSMLIVRSRNPVVLFGLKWPAWKSELPLAALALVALYPLLSVIQGGVLSVVGEKDATQDILLFLIRTNTIEDKLLLSLMAVVFSPISEEIIFRGFLYGVARQYGGRWAAMTVTAALFAAIHIHFPSMPSLFAFAIGLTLIYERTRSLWAPIIVHMLFNATTVAYVLIAKPQL